MGDEGPLLGILVLILGAVIDIVFLEPIFVSMAATMPLTGLNLVTTILFVYGVPYAASCAIAGAIVGGILGAT